MFSITIPAIVIATILTPHVINATTTYGCWSEESHHFREDCLKAAASLILGQTGVDNQAWFPNYLIKYTSGSCTASIKASGNVLPALSVMTSFDQLGSRCQNGYFYYDEGYLDAELQGHAGYKKRDGSSNQTTEHVFGEGKSSGGQEWTLEENIFEISEEPTIDKPKQTSRRGQVARTEKRSEPGVYFKIGRTENGHSLNLYRGARNIVPSLVATHYSLVSTLGGRVMDVIDDALTNTGRAIVKTGYTTPAGSTVNSVVAALQLNSVYSSWQDMFNAFGDSGYIARDLLLEAIADFFRSGYTDAIYHVDNFNGEAVFSFILNGVVGR